MKGLLLIVAGFALAPVALKLIELFDDWLWKQRDRRNFIQAIRRFKASRRIK